MKTYNEKVLTVIAACLVIQTFGELPFIEKAYAAYKPIQTNVCNVYNFLCADVYNGPTVDALYVKIVD
jgi:chitinase